MRVDVEASGAGVVPQAAMDGEVELGAVGRALWRKKWWVLVPTLIAATIAFVVVNLLTPKYSSEARILIDGRENVFLRPEAEKMADRDRAVVDQEAVTSQVQLALSRDLARQAIKQLKLGERPEFDPVLRGISPLLTMLSMIGFARDPFRMTPEERVLESYFDRLAVFPVEKSRVIAIEFQSADPDLAARAANTIAEDYLALQQAARTDQTRAAGRWLAGEIEVLRKKVSEAEAKVEEFRAKSNLFIGTNNTTLSAQQLAELNSQLAAARSQKADAESKARYIRELLRSGQSLESAEFVNSELIRRLSEQRVTLRAQLAEQSSTLLDGHPRIKELKAQIADLERQMRAEAEKLVRSLENDARIAGARVDTLGANLDQLKRQAASTNEQDIELRALEREAKAQRDLLESYLAKYRETNARDSLNAMPTEVRIISRAVVSNTPYFPKKVPIVLIASLATLFVAAGFIVTGELLAAAAPRAIVAKTEPPISDRRTAETFAPAFPRIEPRAEFEPDRPSSAQERSDAADRVAAGAVGSLSAIADRLRQGDDAGRLVAVVGAARNVGTSLTAIALARRLAREARVVLVDLALDNPNLAVIAIDPDMPGIADLVRGTVSFGQVITRDRESRVHVVAAGQVGGDNARILSSERLRIAIDALSRTYEHVVIDAGAASVIEVEHFAALAPHALLVAREATDEAATAAYGRLVAAGFAEVSVLVGPPPQLDVEQPDTRSAAA